MKTMKRNRLRQLVVWGYISQQEANQLWRDCLRGVIPVGKIYFQGEHSIIVTGK